jgi:hypothetical protein
LEKNMTANPKSFRRILLASAGLLIVVAIILIVGVIPQVKADTYQFAAPDRAAPAFWVMVVFSLLTAAAIGSNAIRATVRSRRLLVNFGILAFIVLLFALALTDAAFAFRGHGPDMQTASALLFLCVAADVLAAVLSFTTVFLLPKQA